MSATLLGLSPVSEMELAMRAAMLPDSPPPASSPPDSMTPAQVAAYLQVTEVEVVKVIESGQLKSKKSGSEYRISKEQLEEYLRA